MALADLEGKRTGVVEGYITDLILRDKHPGIEAVPFPKAAAALEALEAGEIDAVFGNLAVVTYEQDRLGLEAIKIAAPTQYNLDLAMGVRKDWPELVSLLNKALDSIDDKERTAIRNAWLGLSVQFGLDLKTILVWAVPIGGSAVLIIAFIVVWNRKLGREIGERKKAEAQLAREGSLPAHHHGQHARRHLLHG